MYVSHPLSSTPPHLCLSPAFFVSLSTCVSLSPFTSPFLSISLPLFSLLSPSLYFSFMRLSLFLFVSLSNSLSPSLSLCFTSPFFVSLSLTLLTSLSLCHSFSFYLRPSFPLSFSRTYDDMTTSLSLPFSTLPSVSRAVSHTYRHTASLSLSLFVSETYTFSFSLSLFLTT